MKFDFYFFVNFVNLNHSEEYSGKIEKSKNMDIYLTYYINSRVSTRLNDLNNEYRTGGGAETVVAQVI